MKTATIAAHASRSGTPGGPVVLPISQTAAYWFDDIDDYANAESGEGIRHTYARPSTETTSDFERAVAALEGAESGVAFASGTAAVVLSLLTLMRPGQSVVMPRDIFGGIHVALREELVPFGYRLCVLDFSDLEAVAAALDRNAGAIICESISNPLLRVENLAAIATLAERAGIPLVVDNTLATPCRRRPLEEGAQLVVHSASKFLSGHSDVVAGVAAGSAKLTAEIRKKVERFGANLGPFEAWLALRGIRTLPLRVNQGERSARVIADLLRASPYVSSVYYPRDSVLQRESNDAHDGIGAVVSFKLAAGRVGAERFVRALQLIRFVGSLGDVTTTVSHPVTTTHSKLPLELRADGIDESLLRISVGIEAVEDLTEDLRRALAASQPDIEDRR